MVPWRFGGIAAAAIVIGGLAAGPSARAVAQLLIVGNDEKVRWDQKGNTILSAPGKDSVVILDLASPEVPRVVANLPIKNSVVGPPVNVAIDPTNSIALVADSVDVIKDGDIAHFRFNVAK